MNNKICYSKEFVFLKARKEPKELYLSISISLYTLSNFFREIPTSSWNPLFLCRHGFWYDGVSSTATLSRDCGGYLVRHACFPSQCCFPNWCMIYRWTTAARSLFVAMKYVPLLELRRLRIWKGRLEGPGSGD